MLSLRGPTLKKIHISLEKENEKITKRAKLKPRYFSKKFDYILQFESVVWFYIVKVACSTWIKLTNN